jgi:vancomycin resistance protein VanJ
LLSENTALSGDSVTPRRDGAESPDTAGSVSPGVETVELPWNRDVGLTLPAQRRGPQTETETEPRTEAGTETEQPIGHAVEPATRGAIAALPAAALPRSALPGAALPVAVPQTVPPTVPQTVPPVADEAEGDKGLPEDSAATEVGEEGGEEDTWPSPRRQIAHAVRILCGVIIVILLGHRFIPDFLGVGSMLDTFLPWTFVPLAVAIPAALGSRSRWAMGVAALAACVWGGDFGPTLVPRGSSGPADIRILSQNVSAQSPDIAAAAALAVKQDADVVVLEGMSSGGVQASGTAALPDDYKYRLALYEFTVWSKFPLSPGQPVDLGGAHDSAAVSSGGSKAGDSGLFGGLLSFDVMPPGKPRLTVFAVHLPQPALSHSGFAIARDSALVNLVAQIKAEPAQQLVVVGDLDLAETDRGMRQLLGGTGLVSAQAKAGSGFGFTWPEEFPMVRLDDVLVRGMTPVRSVVLGATGAKQAHRPIQADLRF